MFSVVMDGEQEPIRIYDSTGGLRENLRYGDLHAVGKSETLPSQYSVVGIRGCRSQLT